jgi:Protein kinase domain
VDVGTHIGRYRLVRQLGTGGFATVWLAADDLLEAPVAIKLLAERWVGREDITSKFINEARLLRRIDDDRVVRVYAIDERAPGQPYFVMALADRGTLYDRLAQDRMRYSVPSALELARALAECLVVIHSYGIVHRDIKPSNILFRSLPPHQVEEGSSPERLVLADFGVATTAATDPRLTGPVGTPAYMAPEQAAYSDGIDARADIFAATAVLYELVAGHAAFESRTTGDAGHAFPVEPIAATRPEVRASLQQLVDCGLSLAPQDRFPSAAAFAAAIRRELLAVAEASGTARPRPSTLADRAVEADPADAVAVLVDYCGGLLPELKTSSARARAALGAPFRVIALIDEGVRPLIEAGAPAQAGMELSIVDPADLEHPEPGLAGPSDVVIVAVAEETLERALELLRVRISPAGPGPVLVLAVRPSASAGAPRPGQRILPSATFDRSPAGFDALWAEVARELSGWGSWARAEKSLAVLAEALANTAGSPAPSAGRRDALDRLESLRLAQPRLNQVQILRAEARGDLAILPPLRSELRRVLGPGPPYHRLGLGPHATTPEMLEVAQKGGERWRALINTGNIPYSARPAGSEVARAYDRLWVSLG